MKLKNNTGAKSKIGYVVKISSKPGFFEYANGSDAIVGVVAESVPPNAECDIATGGVVRVYASRPVVSGGVVVMPVLGSGVVKGTVVPLGKETSYVSIGRAVLSGKGLVPVAFSVANVISSGSSVSWDDIADKPAMLTISEVEDVVDDAISDLETGGLTQEQIEGLI